MAPTETAFLPLDARFTTLFVSPEILRPVAQSRASVTAPIAPSASPSDVDLFESPADATVRFHLPRLRIRTDATSYDLRLTPEDGGWSIRFGIEPYPAPELGDGARTTALAFALPDAALEYAAPPLSRRLVASEIIPDAGGWTIGFHTDLPGKDEVLWAPHPALHTVGLRARMLGVLADGGLELYTRSYDLDERVVRGLEVSAFGRGDRLWPTVLGLVGAPRLPRPSGVSLVFAPDGAPLAITWFSFAKALFASDEATVQALVSRAADPGASALLTALAGGRPDGRIRCGMVGVGVGAVGDPWLQVGLRPAP